MKSSPVARVDVCVRWRGPTHARDDSLAALEEHATVDRYGVIASEALAFGVAPERAVDWALQHLLDAEITWPDWVREWIAEELLLQTLHYGVMAEVPRARRGQS